MDRKIVIEKTVEAKPGASFVLGSGFTILPPLSKDGVPLIVSYKNEPVKKRGRKKAESVEEETNDPDLAALLEREKQERLEWTHKYQIRPGSFQLSKDHGWIPHPFQDEIYYETQTSKELHNIFSMFLTKTDIIKKYKKNKRAYLLHSDPGMGKSALIRNFCKKALSEKGTAVLCTDGDMDFGFLTYLFSQEYASDVEKIILVIEDFGRRDYTSGSNIYNSSCLNFLDGTQSLFRVPTLIITTTNFLKQLGAQLTSRPGRFNRIIKVERPTDDEVFDLVEYFSQVKLNESQKNALRGQEFTPDYCIEAILRSEFENITLENAVAEIKREQSYI